MLMSQFLKSRKTVRDYKKKALLPAAQESIRALIDEKNERLKPYHAKLAFLMTATISSASWKIRAAMRAS